MKYLIYQQTKSAMQSGKKNSKKWLLSAIEDFNSRSIDQLMGWVSSNNTSLQIRFEFLSKEDAIKYAKENNLNYEVIQPNKSFIKPKSYTENFTN